MKIRFFRYGTLCALFALALKASAQTPPIVVGAERLAEAAGGAASVAEGQVLVSELGCAACHEIEGGFKQGPDLSKVGERVNPWYTLLLTANPVGGLPGTTMPDVFGATPPEEREETLYYLTQYLTSLSEPFDWDKDRVLDGDAVARGEDLYHRIGCVACHKPMRGPGLRQREVDELAVTLVQHEKIKLPSVGLPDFKGKTNFASLSSFLLDPHSVFPSGRMPNMKLSPEEAKDIASFLMNQGTRPTMLMDEPIQTYAAHAKLGQQAFQSLGCVACHNIDGVQNDFDVREIDTLDAGCLAIDKAKDVPWYGLSDRQRGSIRMALEDDREPSVEERLVTQLASLNCFACHEREGVGGIEAGRNPYFSALIEADLGDEGRIPPTLTGVGAKLTEKGLSSVLLEDGTVRPYMATRMPRFGEGQVSDLVHAFLDVDDNADALPVDVSGLEHHHRNMYGRQLMGTDGLSCISCHGLYGAKSLGIPAIDLATVPERIQPAWFKEYLLDPAELRPGTRMPSFFEDGKSTFAGVFGGNADQQIEALWIYLREIDQTRLPVGMEGTEDFELVPRDRPIVLRTFMEGVGTHAIAVGYPEGTHVAFDALNVRLAMAWRGKFMDAESTWADRFSPLAQPLSDRLFPASAGMPIGIAAEASGAVGADAGYRFRGYRLNDDGTPTFLYSIAMKDETIQIEEQVLVRKDGQIVRRFDISGNRETVLYVRSGAEDAVPFVVQPSSRSMTVELNWKLD